MNRQQMKIGVISDIHGDLQGLRAALNLLKAHRVDQVVCCGDLVERGTEGDAVVKLIRDLSIPCVQGNHDRDAIFNQPWMRKNMDVHDPRIAAKLLTDDTLSFLKTLPEQLRAVWQGIRLLIVHGTIKSKDQYLMSQASPAMFASLAAASAADVILSGHTHTPMLVEHGGTLFCNPGSIHRDEDRGSSTCAVLTLPQKRFDVYDIPSGKYLTPDDVRRIQSE